MSYETMKKVVSSLGEHSTVLNCAFVNGVLYNALVSLNKSCENGNSVFVQHPLQSAVHMFAGGATMVLGARCASWLFGDNQKTNFVMSSLLCASSAAFLTRSMFRKKNRVSVSVTTVTVTQANPATSKPNEPVQHTESVKHVEPVQQTEPVKHVEPVQQTEPVKHDNDSKESDSDNDMNQER